MTVIEWVCLRSTLFPYSLGGIGEGISQDHEKKSRTVWEKMQPYFTPLPT